jgi:hypothetical protein
MRICIACRPSIQSSWPISATRGTTKTSEMISALAVKLRLRNSRTPGAQTPWWAKKPPVAGESGIASVGAGVDIDVIGSLNFRGSGTVRATATAGTGPGYRPRGAPT